ncbi:CHAT domain-containing protein [Fulvivirgaceae bacterium BMA12]|uniref:CHAT domain-containing protein n=1 Tax=Agaribacillus aureus TaxID=3051825 RepID=A0ABT8LHA3_9BACT|nr:CHAT domain-containing protein [Fulvivirgaceae bacterium BMA12]
MPNEIVKRAMGLTISVAISCLFSLHGLSAFCQSTDIQPDTLLADQYLAKARASSAKARYNEAISYFQKAAPIYRQAGLWTKNITCLDLMADCYRRTGEFDTALEIGMEALQAVEKKLGSNTLNEAKVLNTVGIIHDYKGDYKKALAYHQRSIQIKEQLLGKYHIDLADSYNNLGVIYFYLGDYEQALKAYNQVVTIQQATPAENVSSLGRTYNNIGMIHSLNGDYSLALQYLEKSLPMILEELGEDHPGVASPYNSIGVTYYYKKDFEQALHYQKEALKLKRKHFDETHPSMVLSYNNLGLIYGNMGDHDLALDYFKKSLTIQKRTLGEKHANISMTFRFIGEVYFNAHQYDKALQAYKNALSLREEIFGEKHPEVAESYNDVAKINLLKGDTEAALENSQKAIVANIIDFQDRSPDSTPPLQNYLKQNFLLTSLKLKAEAFEKKFRITNNIEYLKKSLSTFKQCDILIDQISKDRLQYNDKLDFGNISTNVYQKSVAVCIALYELDRDRRFFHQAYYFTEKSKAGVLRQALSDHAAKSFGLVPDSLLAFEKQLKVDRGYYQTKIRSQKTKEQNSESGEIKSWESKLFDLNRSYDSMVLSLEKSYPEYHQLKYKNDIINIGAIPDLLHNQHEALIEYFLSDSMLYVFTITQNDYHVATTPLTQNFDTLIQELRNSVAVRGSGTSDFAATAHQLYLQLFSPVTSHLSDKVDKITIIPHGNLSLIPFELLLSHQPTAAFTNYRALPYLLKDYQISYAYSGTLWSKKHQQKKQWEHQFAGYAPSYQTSLLAKSKALEMYGNYRDEIGDLAYTNDEIQNAATFFPGPTFTGETATESLFKKEGGKHQILHLAMHAIVDEENPLQSKLIFTQNEDSVEDGFLYAYELFDMELDAELAVLSACNTGYGKLAKGEGVMSLGRAFAYAGCPSIVMSLWPAQDQATANIMAYFYEGLSAGYSKDKALREAKLKYLENAEDLFAHPFYWAGFVMQGDVRSLAITKTFGYWWVLGGLVLVLGLIGIRRLKLKPVAHH